MKKQSKILSPVTVAIPKANRSVYVFSFNPNPIITQKQLFALIIKSPV